MELLATKLIYANYFLSNDDRCINIISHLNHKEKLKLTKLFGIILTILHYLQSLDKFICIISLYKGLSDN